MEKPFQRVGSISNAHVGNEFELEVQKYFSYQQIELKRNFSLQIGIKADCKKGHRFDLGENAPSLLVECKSHTWTVGDIIPSAKLTTWNQEMYYFHMAPKRFRKILFTLRSLSKRRKETLAEYYVRRHENMIPRGVEVWEFDMEDKTAKQVYPTIQLLM